MIAAFVDACTTFSHHFPCLVPVTSCAACGIRVTLFDATPAAAVRPAWNYRSINASS